MEKLKTPSASLKLICNRERKIPVKTDGDRPASRLAAKLELLAQSLEILTQQSMQESLDEFSHRLPGLDKLVINQINQHPSASSYQNQDFNEYSEPSKIPGKKNHLKLLR